MAPVTSYPWQNGYAAQQQHSSASSGAARMDTSSTSKRGGHDTASDASTQGETARPPKKRADNRRDKSPSPAPFAKAKNIPKMRPPGDPPGQWQSEASTDPHTSKTPDVGERLPGIEEVWRTLEDHRRCILNLNSYVQTDKRCTQWCLTIKEDSVGLQKVLQASKESWLENRPDKGPHPHGDMCHVLWRGLLHHSTEYASEYSKANPNKKAASDAVVDWLQSTLPTDVGDNECLTLLSAMYKLGNRKLEQGSDWRFIVRFAIEYYCGQQVHEKLADLLQLYGDDFSDITGFEIYKDRAPPSQAEKNLRKSYSDKYRRQ